jgi:hypothetical protein
MINKPVYIVIVNWNNSRDTIECIDSVLKINYPDYKIILVDNNSEDDSLEKIKNWIVDKNIYFAEYDSMLNKIKDTGNLSEIKIIIVKNNYNAGFAGGSNLGIKLALKDNVDYVWLLNNDTVVEKNSLIEMVKLAESDSKIGIIGSKLMSYYEKNKIQDIGGWLTLSSYITGRYYGHDTIDKEEYNKIIEPDYIKGASMLINLNLIKDIGLMNEDYFLYWEETDYCIRAKRNHWKLYYCPTSIVWHKEGATTKKGSKIAVYYYTRNSLIFYKRFFPIQFLIIFIFGFLFKILKRLINKDVYSIKYIIKAYIDFVFHRYGRAEL